MYQTSLTKGQELVAQNMVREFRVLGYDAYLITSVYHDGVATEVTNDEARKRGGYVHIFDRTLNIPVIRVNSGPASWPPRRIMFEDFIGMLTQLVDELDLNVLITHSTLWNGPEEAAKFIRWRKEMISKGAPYQPILFCHMSHFQEPSGERYAMYERSYREIWGNTVLSQIMEEADLILVTTPYEKEFMKRMGADNDKIMLFPGGIDDVSISLGDAKAFRSQYLLGSNKKLISYLGTVEERKNTMAVIQIANHLSKRRDIHFIIAGKLEGKYGKQLKEKASKVKNVSVLGAVSDRDKAGLIKASFANILMSRSEALGISQLEFMSMGVPVITSGTGGQSWIIRSGFDGYVVNGPDDIKGAASAVERLVDNPQQRDRFGKNAANFASRFSMRMLVQSLGKRLENMLEGPREEVPSEHLSSREQVLEVLTYGDRKVIATSKRLIIRPIRNGRKGAVVIPYNEITKIVNHIRINWPILALGFLATLLLLLQRTFGMNLIRQFAGPAVPKLLGIIGFQGLSENVMLIVPLLPILIAIFAAILLLRKGFVVYYGSAPKRKIFLPNRFYKILLLADRLVPRELFAK